MLTVFRKDGHVDGLLVALFALICALLLANAFLHDPLTGYDAPDHQHYVQALASRWALPTRSETGQYYSPPLPYILPAILTTLHFGLWKSLKIAQFFNALLAAGALLYLLRLCELASPSNRRLKLLSLALLGMLPVFYRSFALVRGEPYLAFLSLFVAYEAILVFGGAARSPWHVARLGAGLGLAILARQWGFFLFPPVAVLALFWARGRELKPALARLALAVLAAALVGGWFYVLMLRQYGTLTAFDRQPQPLTAQRVTGLMKLDPSSANVFTDPVRPSLAARLIPILYADTWGDYWGYFLVYARDTRTGEFRYGDFLQGLTDPSRVPEDYATDRFEIAPYLGLLNALALLPSVLYLCGLVYGCMALWRFLRGRARETRDAVLALLAMLALASLAGFGWFILRYQSLFQDGDLIKTTYLLQAFPPLAFLAAAFADRAWDRNPRLWRVLGSLLAVIFVALLPVLVTHYVHISASPAAIGLLISTVLFVAGMVLTLWIHTRYQMDVVVEPVSAPPSGPLISVCVPARNEAANIGRCVEVLLAQTYPNFELIVVDDRSTDETPQILQHYASDPRLKVLHGAPMPEGWAGKPHALVQAAAAARGEWLCFVDADTLLVPEGLASCYASAVESHADMFTMLTRQITGSFWERVVMPLVMTALSVGFPPRRVNDPASRSAVANGQFILIRRSVYDAVGGHERIKDKIVEDKALAELVKWSGYRLILADGRKAASTRMYTSLPQMWEGWTKNIFLGLRAQPNLVFLGAFGGTLLVLAALFLPLWPLIGLYWYLHGGGWLGLAVIAMALGLWAVLLYARAEVLHGMGISRWYALTTPIGSAVFAAMMLTSAWKVLSGRGVTWRGRRYNPG